jgi:hypothetical protein
MTWVQVFSHESGCGFSTGKVGAGFQPRKWVQVFNLHMQLLRVIPQVENLRPLLFRRLKTCGHS